jgi:hypothetical protein
MHRHLLTLTFTSLLALAACTKTNNDVGSVGRDSGVGGQTSQSGGATTTSVGAGGHSSVASGGVGALGGAQGSGGASATSQTGGATSSQGGTGGVGGNGSGGTNAAMTVDSAIPSQGGADGGVADGPNDRPNPLDTPLPYTQHPYVGSGASCLNYPNTTYVTFPYNPSLQGGQQWPTCPLNCNAVLATAGAVSAPLDQALPIGPCDDEGATCDSPLMAGWCPPCTNTGGPGNGYTCTCSGKQWQCAIVSQGMNVCDPPRCLDPSLSSGPYPQSCSQVTWSSTQVCGCGKCLDLCYGDSQCKSGHCNLNQVCRTADSCPNPYACLASCSGTCSPGVGDGGPPTDVADAATADSDGCPAPKVWRYEQAGCDGQVQPICGQAGGDACLAFACGCDGESLAGCDYYAKPYRSKGICPGACFSPTHNLDVIGMGSIKGCACDPTTDQPQCVSRPEGTGAISFTCAGGVWNATNVAACKTCPDGTVLAASYPEQTEFAAFCGKPCATTSDCPADSHCVDLLAILQPSPGPVCVSATNPPPVANPTSGWHRDMSVTCRSANIAEVPYNDPNNQVAGRELIDCPNGCVSPAHSPDASPSPHCQ